MSQIRWGAIFAAVKVGVPVEPTRRFYIGTNFMN